jgi:hypothetical protein
MQMGSNWFRAVSLPPDGRGFIVGATGSMWVADRDGLTPPTQRF